MLIKKVDKTGLLNGVVQALSQQKEDSYYCIYDKNYVYKGDFECPDEAYLQEHNLEICEIPTIGGIIIVSAGDIGFGLTTFNLDKTNSFLEKAKENLIALIESHGYKCTLDGNDILINNFKVASYCSLIRDQVFFGVFQCSVNVNLELIKNICTKPMVKIPKGLSEFGITTEEVEQEVVLKTAREFN